MTVQLAVTFSSLLVEDQYLLTLYQRAYHFANHLGTLYGGETYNDVTIVVNQKNFLKFYCCTSLCILQVMNEQLLAGLSLELLALNFYNCVHLIL